MSTPIQVLEKFAAASWVPMTASDIDWYNERLGPENNPARVSQWRSEDHVYIAQVERDNCSVASVLVSGEHAGVEKMYSYWSINVARGSQFGLLWLLDKIRMTRVPVTDAGMVEAGLPGEQQDQLRNMMNNKEGVKIDAWITSDNTVIVQVAEWSQMTIHNVRQGIFLQLESFYSETQETDDFSAKMVQAAVQSGNFDVVLGSDGDREKDIAELKKKHPNARVVTVNPAYPGEPLAQAVKRVMQTLAAGGMPQ